MGESFNMLRNNTLSRADLSNDRKGVLDIHYGDVLIRYRAVVDVSTLQGPSINITNNRFLGDRLTDGDIIMADTAEDTSAGKCVEIEGIMHQNVVAGLHTIPLRPATPSSHGYWGQYLNSASFRNQLFPKMQGTKVISLSRTTVSNATVRYPSLAEQRRIGEFFTTLDNLIAAAERQEALLRQKKQAYLQLMFPQEGETEPRLRFAGFSGEWSRRQLGELITEHKETVDSHCTLPILTSSKTEGITLQEEHFGHKQSHDIAGYNVVPRGYCTYRNRSDDMDFTFNVNNYCDKGIISKFYPVFRGNGNDTLFISLVLNHCEEVLREIGYTCTGTGQRVLAFSDLQMMRIPIPTHAEQQKVAKFFEIFDSLIVATEQRTESLRALKSAYLQRMFV